MIHFDKRTKWAGLNERQRTQYKDRKDYYAKTAMKVLEMGKLSENGTKFDAELFKNSLEDPDA